MVLRRVRAMLPRSVLMPVAISRAVFGHRNTSSPMLFSQGWPETWYSWRHQLPVLAQAGFRALAPDMRGYGRSDAPGPIEAYTQLHIVGDMVGLIDALEIPEAVIVGHDWGAPVAWNAAL